MAQSIAFIGGGAMAEAIIKGILKRGLFQPGDIRASEPIEPRRQYLAGQYGIGATADNAAAAQRADIVILAVKPQTAAQAMAPMKGRLTSSQLVISIMAGVPIRTITAGLGHDAVVRVMPNTPAQIEQGMSVWTATASVSEAQRAQAAAILGSLGREVQVPDEHYLDAATAMNGSGPAYVFLFLEAFIDAGVHIGFARPVAEELALQTMLGSILMAKETGRHPAELRNMVTSPAGTTAAALQEFEEGRFRAVVTRAIVAAYQRSIELGKEA